jgi:hypothetical protein
MEGQEKPLSHIERRLHRRATVKNQRGFRIDGTDAAAVHRRPARQDCERFRCLVPLNIGIEATNTIPQPSRDLMSQAGSISTSHDHSLFVLACKSGYLDDCGGQQRPHELWQRRWTTTSRNCEPVPG